MDINSKEFKDTVYEIHMSYYRQGKFGYKSKKIKEIVDRTGVSKKEAKRALDEIIHPYGKQWLKDKEREDREKERAIRKEKREKFFDWCEDYSSKRNTVRCPKCHSTSISYDSKKVSVGRAIVGNAVAGPTGAIIGGLSGKKGYAVCLNCGKRWKI